MHALEVIEKKRDGLELSGEEIAFFVNGYTRGEIPDYQASALLMACFINGLSEFETTELTEAMLHSGEIADLDGISGYKADKHSTGGVGDKVSLIVAPAVAACGVRVPMISGRGLGHTGGTLDKLESIPGFNVDLSLTDYARILDETGLCLMGQTKEIAPADGKLYALRDVTGTVPHRSLIAASIMSKKMAEGIDGLVMDVKCGRGAFMRELPEARELARIILAIGRGMGRDVAAVITAMDQPLGRMCGNALEVVESVQVLRGEWGPLSADLAAVCARIAARMLIFGGKAADVEEGEAKFHESLRDGSALATFREIVAAQQGDVSAIDDTARLPASPNVADVTADRDGYVGLLDAYRIGRGCVILGAGRATKEDSIDPACGVELVRKLGDRVSAGEPIMRVHYGSETRYIQALDSFRMALEVTDEPPKVGDVIIEEMA